MRPDELLELIRAKPYIPLRFHLTDGTTYDLRHPDNVIVLRGRVDLGVSSDPTVGIVDRVDRVSLLHLVRVEELAAVPAGGGTADADD